MNRWIINQVQTHSSNMPDAVGTDKFMVVVAVIAILFLGIVGYMISLDLKLKKLEKK